MASYKEWTYTYLCLSQTSRESDGKHQGDAKWGRAFREQHYADQTSQQPKREWRKDDSFYYRWSSVKRMEMRVKLTFLKEIIDKT